MPFSWRTSSSGTDKLQRDDLYSGSARAALLRCCSRVAAAPFGTDSATAIARALASALGQRTQRLPLLAASDQVLLMCGSCGALARASATAIAPTLAFALGHRTQRRLWLAASYQLRLTRTRTRARHRVARLGRALCPTAHPVSYGTFHASMACSGVAFPPLVMSALVRHGPGPWCSTAPLMARQCTPMCPYGTPCVLWHTLMRCGPCGPAHPW